MECNCSVYPVLTLARSHSRAAGLAVSGGMGGLKCHRRSDLLGLVMGDRKKPTPCEPRAQRLESLDSMGFGLMELCQEWPVGQCAGVFYLQCSHL